MKCPWFCTVRSGGEPTQTTEFIKGRFENTAALIKALTAKRWWMRAAFKQFLFTLELVKFCRLNAYSLLFYRLYNGNTVGQQFGPKCCRGDKIGCGISLDSDDGQVTVFFTKNGKKVCALSSTLPFNLHRFLSFQLQQFHVWMCRWAVWKLQPPWTLSTPLWGCTLWERKYCWTWTQSGGRRRTMVRW